MKVKIRGERCKQCGLCVQHCPRGAAAFGETLNAAGYKRVVVDDDACVACGACYTMCPDGVFEIMAQP